MMTEADEDDYDQSELGEDFDVAELVTENQILVNRVDALLGGDDDALSTRRSIDQSAEIESLTDSIIDGLFK